MEKQSLSQGSNVNAQSNVKVQSNSKARSNASVQRKKGTSVSRLAEHIKKLRKENGLKQSQVAQHLSIARQTYSCYETGRIVPSMAALAKLAGLYKLPLSTFSDDLGQTGGVDVPQSISIDTYISEDERKAFSKAYLDYCNLPENRERMKSLSPREKRLLFYFNKLTVAEQEDMLTYQEIKFRRRIEN